MSRVLLAAAVALCTFGCGEGVASIHEGYEAFESVDGQICADPEGCEIPSDLPTPGTVKVTGRSVSSLTVQFSLQVGWKSWSVQRRAPGGTWGAATSGNTVSSSNTREWTDNGRGADTRTCYRLKATNTAGTAYGGEACGLTQAAAGTPNPGLSRLQLRVKVANVSDAETSDKVGLNLSRLSQPGYHFMGLNAAPRQDGWLWKDDFSRGNDFTFDVNLGSLSRLRDISELTITKYGSDALCIERLELLVNGRAAVVQDFGVSTCRWIDGDAGFSPTLSVTFEQLRAMPSFTQFVNPTLSNAILRDEIEARIEAIIGNAIWARNDMVWGDISGRAVEATFVNGTTVHVDGDLKLIKNNWPDATVDVDFDVQARFERNASNTGFDLVFDVQNFVSGADLPWWTEALGSVCYVSGSNCATYIEHHIEDAVEAGFSVTSQRIPATTDAELAARGCTVPTVEVQPGPFVQFWCR